MNRPGSARYILALDQGTSSSRALVVDEAGAVRGFGQEQQTRSFPQPGWVEQDAAAIWRSQLASAAAALEAARLGAADLAAIGITNQRETTIIWERATSRPIAPAVVWQDRRTAPLCNELRRAGHEAEIRAKTGLVLDPYFSATKIAWLLDNIPDARARAEAGEFAFGTVDSWLTWCLSEGRRHVSDATNAARTLLWNIHEGVWDADLLELFSVPRELLPEVVDTTGPIAEASVDGLAGVPITALVGDQQAALYGQACTGVGMTKVTYGTGGFILMNTGATPAVSQHGLLTTVALQRPGRREYALEGSILSAGAAVAWLRDGLGLIDDVAASADIAAGVKTTEGVYFVPALTGLGAPHWRPHARGTLVGLNSGTSAAHVVRATLEGIAFQVVDLVDALTSDGGVAPDEIRVDGGAAGNDTLLQIQADVLGLPIVRPAVKEATALGAAGLAGLGVGLWRDQAPCVSEWRADRRFAPRTMTGERQELRAEWRAALAAANAFADRER